MTQPDTDRPYVALARRYRPKSFADFVGLEHIARTLQNSISQGRVGHAYLFCGPRGIGKTSMVRVFAMALNCLKGPATEPCGECDSCLTTHRGEGIDVIEIDGASHTGVDDVRELRERVIYSPAKSRYKIFVIDEVHMLSKSAFNALLKTLEEPPPHVKFMFATTEPQKVIETIQSRCQRFDFPRISADDIAERLARICKSEGVTADKDTLAHIARNVRGGLRDALSILDQLIAYDGKEIRPGSVYKVMGSVPEETIAALGEAIERGDVKGAMKIVGEAITMGKESGEFVEALSGYFRDVLVMRNCGPDFDGFLTGPAIRDRLARAAGVLDEETLLYAQQVLGDLRQKLRLSANPAILLETAIVRLCRWRDFAAFGALLANFSPPEESAAPPINNEIEPPPRRETANRPDPAPATAKAAAAAEKVSGDIDLDDWKNAIDKIYKVSGFLGTALGNARFIGAADGVITLGFIPEWKFLREQLGDSARRRQAEEKLTEIFGRQISLKVVEIEGEAGKAPHSDAANAADPLVKKALDLFGGHVIEEIEPDSRNSSSETSNE